jgi:hypothetical protein
VTEDDKHRFAVVIRAMGIVHDKNFGAEAVRAYWEDLKEMDIHEFERVSAILRKSSQWMPKPATFWTTSKTVGWT